MLQSFGTELAETELPDDMYSIERILALRTEKYYQLKVCLITSSAAVCIARGNFWGWTASVFDARSSIPPKHVSVLTDKIKQHDCLYIIHAFVMHSSKLPSRKQSQLTPPYLIQKTMSKMCCSSGVCLPLWQQGSWEASLLAPAGVPSASFPLLKKVSSRDHEQVQRDDLSPAPSTFTQGCTLTVCCFPRGT